MAASSAVAPRRGTELRASPPPTLGFPAVAPECPPQRAPHRLPVSASPSHAQLPRTLPSPRLPDVQRHLETPSLGDPGRGGRGARGRDPEGPGWGGGAFPPGMASSAGARWGGRTRAAAGCSRAWHRLGGAARAPQTGRRGAGAPSAGTLEDCRPAAWRREGRAGCPGAAAPRARREAPARPAAGFPVGTSVPRCVSVCVCGALTLPVAGTVLVPMAGLGLLLVPALLPAPPPAPSSAGGRGPAVAVPLGRVSRGPQVLPRGAAVRSRPLQLCLRGGDRAWPLQRQAPAEPGSL